MSVRIFTNIALPAQFFPHQRFKSAEISAEWWQKKGYAWVGEFGFMNRTRNNGDYEIGGTFVRLGIEKGFWERQPERRVNGSWQTGARLGFGVSDYRVKSVVKSPYWGETTLTDEVKGIFSTWIETHTSLRARFGKRFVMGPFFRVKWLIYSPSTTLIGKPIEMAGFGVRKSTQAEAGYWVGIWLGK